jgi:hypothetical protein
MMVMSTGFKPVFVRDAPKKKKRGGGGVGEGGYDEGQRI